MIIKLLILIILFAFLLLMMAYRDLLRWLVAPLTVYLAIGIFFTIKPEVAGDLAKFLGVGRGTDLIIYLYILGTNFIILILFIKIKFLGQQITKMTKFMTHVDARLNDSERECSDKIPDIADAPENKVSKTAL